MLIPSVPRFFFVKENVDAAFERYLYALMGIKSNVRLIRNFYEVPVHDSYKNGRLFKQY